MSGTIIFIAVMVITVCLGRYAIAEGQRAERQKRMLEDIKKWGDKKINNMWTTTTTFGDYPFTYIYENN